MSKLRQSTKIRNSEWHWDNSVEHFFSQLVAETAEQFKNSPAYKKQYKQGMQWNYSVCATPISKNKPVIFGINWGRSDHFESQDDSMKFDDITKYPFIKRCKKNLELLGLNLSEINFNYTNLCFFRSQKAIQLEDSDYRLSIPLFEKYVRYINPKWILSIGIANFKILNKFDLLRNIEAHFFQNGKVIGYSANLWDWDVYFVPHPNAQFTNEARSAIWSIITTKINEDTNNP